MNRPSILLSCVLNVGYILLVPRGLAFLSSFQAVRPARLRVLPETRQAVPNIIRVVEVSATREGLRAQARNVEHDDVLKSLDSWRQNNEDVDGAALEVVSGTSPAAVLTRYYESLAAGTGRQMILVAPDCAIEVDSASVVERALSSSCSSRVYHPRAEDGRRKAPHFMLWHEAPAETFSPSSIVQQQTASLSESSVMEEVFLWLQRTMLGMVDSEEDIFVDLGRKLLTVHRYVVVNATTEAELSRTFWAEAYELASHGSQAAARFSEAGDADEQMDHKIGGGGDPREDSVLLALPGFRFNDREHFSGFVEHKLAGPLKTLSPLGADGVPLFANFFLGEELKFPVILLTPYLKEYPAPEGGYKFINGRGEVQDADEFIRNSEAQMTRDMGNTSPPPPL